MANQAYTSVTSDAMTTVANAGQFVPELWSDEIVASYKSNLVLGNLVRKMSMKGKKGDTIHVPKPTRASTSTTSGANAKAAGAAVTIIEDSNSEVVITIDRHFEYSKLIEDIADVQSLASMRRFFTEDAGYSMAKQLDNDLFRLGVTLDGGAFSQDPTTPAVWVSNQAYTITTAGALAAYAGNTNSLVDGFRAVTMRSIVQKLDDADVPMTNRFFVIPPIVVNLMRGVTEFISEDFVSGKPTETGKVGNLYGIPVYVSTNCPPVTTTGTPNAERMCLLAHKDAYVAAEQVGVRSQTQYKQEYLATLLTSDRLYGVKAYRPEGAIVLAVDAG